LQLPDWHVLPPLQTVPQAPQLLLSVWLLRQVAEQQMPPLPRLLTQLVLQLPQAVASVLRFLQTPPQSVSPAGHLQAPDWHVLPPVQTLPQLPQLLLSVCRFLQLVPQHCVPAAHLMSQPPQLLLSLVTLRQA